MKNRSQYPVQRDLTWGEKNAYVPQKIIQGMHLLQHYLVISGNKNAFQGLSLLFKTDKPKTNLKYDKFIFCIYVKPRKAVLIPHFK